MGTAISIETTVTKIEEIIRGSAPKSGGSEVGLHSFPVIKRKTEYDLNKGKPSTNTVKTIPRRAIKAM